MNVTYCECNWRLYISTEIVLLHPLLFSTMSLTCRLLLILPHCLPNYVGLKYSVHFVALRCKNSILVNK